MPGDNTVFWGFCTLCRLPAVTLDLLLQYARKLCTFRLSAMEAEREPASHSTKPSMDHTTCLNDQHLMDPATALHEALSNAHYQQLGESMILTANWLVVVAL